MTRVEIPYPASSTGSAVTHQGGLLWLTHTERAGRQAPLDCQPRLEFSLKSEDRRRPVHPARRLAGAELRAARE